MSVLYISNIGQMACFNDFVWINARLEFKYTESIFIVSSGLESEARKYIDENSHVVVLAHPFHGTEYYEKYVDKIIKTVVTVINDYRRSGMDIEEIVINTAGGTEKMSLIIKDCVEILKDIHPNVKQIWGAFAGTTSIYTEKPSIDSKSKSNEILAKHLISKKTKVTTVCKPADVPADKIADDIPVSVQLVLPTPTTSEIVHKPAPVKPVPVKPPVKLGKSAEVLERERLAKEASIKRKAAIKREKAASKEAKRLAIHKEKMLIQGEKPLYPIVKEKIAELLDSVESGKKGVMAAGAELMEFSSNILARYKEKFEREYTSTSDEIVPD